MESAAAAEESGRDGLPGGRGTMSVDLEDKLAAMGIMNATAYAKKFAEDEWTWEALVRCSDEMLDVLVQRVGMKEGSALMLKSSVRCVRDDRAQLELFHRILPATCAVGFAMGFAFDFAFG